MIASVYVQQRSSAELTGVCSEDAVSAWRLGSMTIIVRFTMSGQPIASLMSHVRCLNLVSGQGRSAAVTIIWAFPLQLQLITVYWSHIFG